VGGLCGSSSSTVLVNRYLGITVFGLYRASKFLLIMFETHECRMDGLGVGRVGCALFLWIS